MFVTHYGIHLMNGEVLHITECTIEDKHPFLKKFRETKPEDILECGMADGPRVYIPMQNILYISALAE